MFMCIFIVQLLYVLAAATRAGPASSSAREASLRPVDAEPDESDDEEEDDDDDEDDEIALHLVDRRLAAGVQR